MELETYKRKDLRDGYFRRFPNSDIPHINYPLRNPLTIDENGIITNCDYSATSVVIPDGVTCIGRGAFSECKDLTSIVIPDGVTSIERFAFSECESLISIEISDSVTSIDDFNFDDCKSLSQIKVGKNNPCYMDIDGVLFSKDGTELIVYPQARQTKEYCIPHGVTSIKKRAFYGCACETSVVIPDSVKNIGDSAFQCFYGMTSIVIPDSVTSIGVWSFKSCSKLTSVVIPDGVTSIGDGAFHGCI